MSDKLQAMAETAEAPANKAVEEKKIVEFESLTVKINGRIVTVTRDDIEGTGLMNRWFFKRISEHEDVLQAVIFKLTK